MKIQVVSDLHLDLGNTSIISKTASDIIVFAGNISNGFKLESEFAKKIAKSHKKKVIIVNGNSSFHNNSLYEVQKKWRNANIPNVKYLDHTTGFIADGINFLGGTLWIDYTNKTDCWTFTSENKEDFDSIKVSNTSLLTPNISTHQHLLLLDHIKHNLSNDHKNVIVTHHSPTYKSAQAGYIGKEGSCHYANDIDDFIEQSNIDLWIHGHASYSYDYEIGGTRVVCNPRGNKKNKKNGINNRYNPSLIIEI